MIKLIYLCRMGEMVALFCFDGSYSADTLGLIDLYSMYVVKKNNLQSMHLLGEQPNVLARCFKSPVEMKHFQI